MSTQSNEIENPSAYASVLAEPSFRTLWFGQICSQLAVNSLLFTLALRIYQTTHSNTAVSALFLAYGIPAVLFGLIAGTAVDKLDKRRVLIMCDVIRACFVLTLLFFSSNVFIVYIITFINAVITQFYVPSEAPLIPNIVPKGLLVSANSLFTLTFYSSLAIGSILAGPLLRVFGPHSVFVVISALFFTASFFSSRIRSQSRGTIGFYYIIQFNFFYILRRIWSSLVEGVRYVRESKPLFDSIMLLTGTQIIMALLATLGPGFADRELHIDIRDASLFIVGPAVLGILLGTLWVGITGYKLKAERLIEIGVESAGWVLIAIALFVRVAHIHQMRWLVTTHALIPIEMILFFLLGAANSLLDVPANSLLQEKAHGSLRGRVYGMLTAFVGGVGILPIIASGLLADTVGIGNVILILGVLIVAYGVYRVRYNG